VSKTFVRFRNPLLAIILAYLVVGALYAALTPPWQAPDEPAHYNYVRYLAENRRLPVLQMGDYPHDYLEEIKAAKFPATMSIDPIRYEFYQPPLYYVLAGSSAAGSSPSASSPSSSARRCSGWPTASLRRSFPTARDWRWGRRPSWPSSPCTWP